MSTSKAKLISKIIIFIMMISLCSVYAKTLTYHSNPENIIREIKLKGAAAVVWELYDEHNIWISVLRKIASGEESWLKVANALKGGSDAGSSEMLSLAVGEALEHNPVNVFKITLSHFELQDICSGPDVDDIR